MTTSSLPKPQPDRELDIIRALERKVLWLSSWMIHNANHLRPNRDGLKVGGHQASSASVATLMSALYFDQLRPQDRVAVKPHASPVFHAIQYMLGNQTLANLQNFRGFGGAQSYPSRTKDTDDIDFSTGSVGLGVAMTSFAALAQDYVRLKNLSGVAEPPGRMIAIAGDAELDEGNVFEALLEGWKHDIRNLWWIVDYNRQSLDSVVSDRLFQRIDNIFATMGWNVVTLKYGRKQEAAFQKPGGGDLQKWIDECPNSLYSALTFKGGAAWRGQLLADLGHKKEIRRLLDDHDDRALQELMTNLGGHDIESVLNAYDRMARDDKPTCLIAYTIKGFGLPFAGHKDNHAGLMTPDQMARFQSEMGIASGDEWDRYAGLAIDRQRLDDYLRHVPFIRAATRRHEPDRIAIPALPVPTAPKQSTQEAFGRILTELSRQDDALAARLVTMSPDVTVSTNLGGWVNRKGVFDRQRQDDVFRQQQVASAQRWILGPEGQHIELGIAENNLFLALAAFGLSGSLFGGRLFPVGTLYDPFILRGLDALNYALYQDARFMVVATPSGLTLAPEGGAHQSTVTPLIGMGLPHLASFEPAYADELTVLMEWGFDYMQRADGGSVYLRLSTRGIAQPERGMTGALRDAIIAGGYWLIPPGPGTRLALVYCGAVAPEILEARSAMQDDMDDVAVLAVTSPGRLHEDWLAWQRGERKGALIDTLLGDLDQGAGLVTVTDGHPAALSWLGAVRGNAIMPLGIVKFGQSGDIPDLYRAYELDADAIIAAAARLLTPQARKRSL